MGFVVHNIMKEAMLELVHWVVISVELSKSHNRFEWEYFISCAAGSPFLFLVVVAVINVFVFEINKDGNLLLSTSHLSLPSLPLSPAVCKLCVGKKHVFTNHFAPGNVFIQINRPFVI